jgi:titin
MNNVKLRSYDQATMLTLRSLLANTEAQHRLTSGDPVWGDLLAVAAGELPTEAGTWQVLEESAESAATNEVGWSTTTSTLTANILSRSGRLCDGLLVFASGAISTSCGEEVLVENPVTSPSTTATPPPSPTPPPAPGDDGELTTIAPQSAPQNVTVAMTDSEGVVSLAWDAVPTVTTASTTSPVTGYRVFRYEVSVAAYLLEATLSATTTTLPVSGPGYSLGETISFRVVAYNSAGEGPVSETASSLLVGAPATPTRTSSSFTDGNLSLVYAITPNSARPVDSATITLDPRGMTNGNITSTLTIDGFSAGVTVDSSQISKSTTYDITVTLTNSFGATIYVDPAEIVVADVPNMPQNLNWAFTANEGELLVTWDAMTGTTQRPLTGYRLFQYSSEVDGFLQVYQGSEANATVSGLQLGVLARFMVAAYGSEGESPRSQETSATPIGSPSQADLDTQTFGSGEALFEFTFTQLTARPVTAATVTATAGGVSQSLAINLDLPNEVGSVIFEPEVLARDVTYTVTYTLENAFTTTTYSGGTVRVPISAPSAPTITNSVPGDARLTLTLSAPTNTGGLPVLDYTVTCTDPNGKATSVTSATSPVAVTGLTNEVDHSCVAAARSSAGLGVDSAVDVNRPTIAVYLPFTPDASASGPGHAMNGLFYHLGTNQGTTAFSNPPAH